MTNCYSLHNSKFLNKIKTSNITCFTTLSDRSDDDVYSLGNGNDKIDRPINLQQSLHS